MNIHAPTTKLKIQNTSVFVKPNVLQCKASIFSVSKNNFFLYFLYCLSWRLLVTYPICFSCFSLHTNPWFYGRQQWTDSAEISPFLASFDDNSDFWGERFKLQSLSGALRRTFLLVLFSSMLLSRMWSCLHSNSHLQRQC